jgi:hypothetical protein
MCALSNRQLQEINGLRSSRYITFGGGGKLQVLLVFIDKSLDEVDLFESQLNGVQMLGLAGDVSRPELRTCSNTKVVHDTDK